MTARRSAPVSTPSTSGQQGRDGCRPPRGTSIADPLGELVPRVNVLRRPEPRPDSADDQDHERARYGIDYRGTTVVRQ